MKKLIPSFMLLLGSLALTAQETIQYTVDLKNAVHHEAFISMLILKVPAGPLQLRMSRSSPGRYAMHEFGKNVYDIHAYNTDGKELKILNTEGDVYEIPQHQGKVKVTYTLFGNWVDGTYAGIDYQHAHLNMPATFMWVPALQNQAIAVKFNLPADWKVAT